MRFAGRSRPAHTAYARVRAALIAGRSMTCSVDPGHRTCPILTQRYDPSSLATGRRIWTGDGPHTVFLHFYGKRNKPGPRGEDIFALHKTTSLLGEAARAQLGSKSRGSSPHAGSQSKFKWR